MDLDILYKRMKAKDELLKILNENTEKDHNVPSSYCKSSLVLAGDSLGPPVECRQNTTTTETGLCVLIPCAQANVHLRATFGISVWRKELRFVLCCSLFGTSCPWHDGGGEVRARMLLREWRWTGT